MADRITVDFVARGPTDDVWQLVLVEEGPWQPPYEHKLQDLQNRLYGCIDAAIDGAVAAKFPLTKGRRICIRVDAYNLPRSETQSFFDVFSSNVLALPEYAEALATTTNVSGIEFEIQYQEGPTPIHMPPNSPR